MKIPETPTKAQYEISEAPQGAVILRICGNMDASNAGPMIQTLSARLREYAISSLTVDLEGVDYLDDFGALVLIELRKMATHGRAAFHIIHASDKIKDLLSILDFDSLDEQLPIQKKSSPSVFVHIGEATIQLVSDMKYVLSFIGSIIISLVHVCSKPRSLRKNDTLLYMQRVGVEGLPIVALISFLMGLIMAFMSSVQLQQFGANIYVASLVSLAMTRELGPIITAIIVAGRSGSAFAAEIGTMKISEEVDALFTMGFNPVLFLAVPKLIAAVIMVPILTLFSDLFAIMGGLLVGVSMLDLTVNSYIAQTIKTLSLFDVFWGVLKSGIFAALITLIGCLRGFQVRGGAASVGQATTSAVVSSIFMIILSDSIFSVILRYWG
ncbi:MAG: phospholipid/cholesterol/gamma-HCH transport system permease protein [Thermodesulfobacteriota bacterium]|nr:phospholipid/cholesterol/gamma-HCH transport system permease protein [Thermodesulfobacteriota bacterium]